LSDGTVPKDITPVYILTWARWIDLSDTHTFRQHINRWQIRDRILELSLAPA